MVRVRIIKEKQGLESIGTIINVGDPTELLEGGFVELVDQPTPTAVTPEEVVTPEPVVETPVIAPETVEPDSSAVQEVV